ncbi:MAG: aminoacyl-tRNA deacylase [Anaerolineales bacterium]
MISNNVTRLLDNRKISYQVYQLPQEKLGGEQTAEMLGVSPELVFKSIVITRRGPGKPILAVVPGNQEVDLKKLARVVGEKKVSPATQKEAEELTQLQVGGISPLALVNRGFQILVHRSALDGDALHVSGGERGLNIRLAPQDLIKLTGARTADIC